MDESFVAVVALKKAGWKKKGGGTVPSYSACNREKLLSMMKLYKFLF